MLKSCAKKMLELADPTGLVWVDLGGGTAENVKTMSKYIDLSKFEKIYVGLCVMWRRRKLLPLDGTMWK